ncbi:MAG: hypothetical protein GC129_06010 [Proteobacteria bacterium]|nr:hypothetical protein [Pseudomonadota bacterium]
MASVAFVLGSSPPPTGSLEAVNRARLEKALELWLVGAVTHFVFMGRKSSQWHESEAAYLARHFKQLCFNHGRPVPPENVLTDDRPKSTSESLQMITQWETYLACNVVKPGTIMVVTNAIYCDQIHLLIHGTRLRQALYARVIFQGAPDVLKSKNRRVRMAELKARLDPYDRWVNQFRISEQHPLLKTGLRALDLSLLVWLRLVRGLGFAPRPRKSLPPLPANLLA